MKILLYSLAGFGALVVLALVTLLLMGFRGSAGSMVSTIELNTPPEEVWLWINDPERLTQWVSSLEEVREDNAISGIGAKRTWVMHNPDEKKDVEIEAETTQFDPPRKLGVHLASKSGFTGDATYTLTDLGDGKTRLLAQGKLRYDHWFARLMEPVVTPQARKKQRADLETLKRKAESGV